MFLNLQIDVYHFRTLLTLPTFTQYPSFVPTEPFSTKNCLTVTGGKWNQVDRPNTAATTQF